MQSQLDHHHAALIDGYSELTAHLEQKAACLHAVQESRFPATQLPKVMQALEHQHAWEEKITECLEHLVEVVAWAAEGSDHG